MLGKSDVVYITPVISRSHTGDIVPELGAGGGGDDLLQSHELKLDNEVMESLTKLISEKVSDRELRIRILGLISQARLSERSSIGLDVLNVDEGPIRLDDFVKRIVNLVQQGHDFVLHKTDDSSASIRLSNIPVAGTELPRTIVCSTFDSLSKLLIHLIAIPLLSTLLLRGALRFN